MRKCKTVMLITRTMEARCFAEGDLDRIAAVTDLHRARTDTLTDQGQRAAMAGAEIIITGWGSCPITPDLLEVAPGLKLMCHSAGSVKAFVCPSFLERGIRVCSAAAALAIGVAEFAFGMMLVSMKGAWQYHATTLGGRWDRESGLPWVREPHGAVVGIVGASYVGREMIRLCKTLDLKAILVYDPYLSQEEALALGVVKVELDQLMRQSDVVSLHTPATEEARQLINAKNLALLKDHAIFINTARGMCVDEEALIAELRKDRIFACIDVTQPEPPVLGSPLYSLPNCILTPHIAGAIKENQRRQGALVADQIESYVRGNPLKCEVNLTQLYRIA